MKASAYELATIYFASNRDAGAGVLRRSDAISIGYELAKAAHAAGFAEAVEILREPSGELIEACSRAMEVEGSTITAEDAVDGQWQTWTEQAAAALRAAAAALAQAGPQGEKEGG